MLFNFRQSNKKYSSKKNSVNYLKHLYHQQSFSEIADEHVNKSPYMFELSNELSDTIVTRSNKTQNKTNE